MPAAYEGMTEAEAEDHYTEILGWLSGQYVNAVQVKDARAARIWALRCLNWQPPPSWEAGPGESLLALLAAQIPKGGDAQERLGWLREYGRVLGMDGPVQEELPGLVA